MVLAVVLLELLPSKTVYVSPAGLDANPGTSAKPVRTVQRAVNLARTMRPGHVAIHLRKGRFDVLRTIQLGSRDDDTEFVGDGVAWLSGGKQLTRWRSLSGSAGRLAQSDVDSRIPPAARAHVLVCDVSAISDLGSLKPRGFGTPLQKGGLQLYEDMEPLPLARYPASGKWLNTGEPVGTDGFVAPDRRPERWKSLDDAWVFGYFNYDWAESYLPIQSYESATSTLTFGAAPPYGVVKDRRFYYMNVPEELDEPGEWYLDRNAKRIYVWPRHEAGPRMGAPRSSLVASVLPGPVFDVVGADRITFKGLVLAEGRDCAVRVRNSTHVVVDRCLIWDFGTWGVSFEGGSDCGIRRSNIRYTGEDGVMLVAGDFKAQKPGRLFAENCHISDYSCWCRTYHPGVLIGGYANRISHNLIENAPHQAILLSGNEHVIEYNDIRSVCTETGDAGAVYMGRDTTMRGNVIRFNRFRKIGPTVTSPGGYTGVMSVYLDDCWSGTTISGNVFEGPGTGIMIGGGRDNVVENNVFVGTDPAIHFDARGRGWAAKYFVPHGEWNFFESFEAAHVTEPPYSTHYPELARTVEGDLKNPAGNKVLNNVCVGPWINYLDGLSEKDLEYRGNVLLKKGTLAQALKSGSRGFVPIPTDRIGPRP